MRTSEQNTDTGWTRGVFDCDRNVWTRDANLDRDGGWYGEVWPDHGGWRYAFHCGHTVADPHPDFPDCVWFLHCHGSGGAYGSDVYPTADAAMVACEQAAARGLPPQDTPLGRLTRERFGTAAGS